MLDGRTPHFESPTLRRKCAGDPEVEEAGRVQTEVVLGLRRSTSGIYTLKTRAQLKSCRYGIEPPLVFLPSRTSTSGRELHVLPSVSRQLLFTRDCP